jgi:hypothetical protein
MLTLVIAVILGVLVVGGISLAALEVIPVGDFQPSTGDLSQILKLGGGGLLIAALGGFMVNGGLKAIITRRAVVTDEWDNRREKRGCSAVMQGISSTLLGLALLAGGLGLMTVAFFQEVLPWLGF